MSILLVVIGCNFSKAICMLVTVWKMNQPTLVTLGDAISSFLQFPDDSTDKMCLASKKAIQAGQWKRPPEPRYWDKRRYFWFRATTPGRLIACNILYVQLLQLLLYGKRMAD